MSRIFLYAHGGSGNHGCAAIVRSTARILEGNELSLISYRPKEDIRYGINEQINVIEEQNKKINRFSFDFLRAYLSLKLKKNYTPMDKLGCKSAF